MSDFAYLAGVLKGDGYLYMGQSGRPRFQDFEPNTLDEKRSFVTGFFESERTARRQVYHNRVCYRIAIYNKELSLLRRIRQLVAIFGLEMRLRNYGSRVPFLELQNRAGFNKFLAIFGEKR